MKLLAALVMLALAGLLAGCGGTSGTPDRPAVGSSPGATSSSGGRGHSGIHLTGGQLHEVASPSGNIACLFENDTGHRPSVRCDVNGATWHVKTPRTCPGAYGDSVTLARRPILTCHTDTVFDPSRSRTLPYGVTATFGDLTCRSARTGITCTNTRGHGFTVARTSYRMF